MPKKVLARIAACKKAAADRGDVEAEWLASYAAQLFVEATRVVGHLERLSGPGFVPRTRLERAARGERLDGKG